MLKIPVGGRGARKHSLKRPEVMTKGWRAGGRRQAHRRHKAKSRGACGGEQASYSENVCYTKTHQIAWLLLLWEERRQTKGWAHIHTHAHERERVSNVLETPHLILDGQYSEMATPVGTRFPLLPVPYAFLS